MSEVILFAYDLADAWGIPISSVAVYDGDKPYVCFTARYAPLDEKTIYIGQKTIDEIKSILRPLNIFELDELTHVIVMDGYDQHFVYNSGITLIELQGSNISYCTEEPQLYPNTMAIIKALNKISRVLTPLGVDKKRFALK